MKIVVKGKQARLTPTGGMIRDKQNLREYSEVVTDVKHIWRYEDADSVHYDVIPVDTLPEEVKEVFDDVVDLIVTTAVNHDALNDLRNLPEINIASLFALAHAKGVSDAELTGIVMQVVMLKTDIEAKLPRSWYDTWNGNLKPYLLEKIASVA